MRAKHTAQNSLFDPQAIDHPIADDLEGASRWLDAHPELLDALAADLDGSSVSGMGRHGLTCETVLRCAVLVHLRQASYLQRASLNCHFNEPAVLRAATSAHFSSSAQASAASARSRACS